jgi:hypothetical protein
MEAVRTSETSVDNHFTRQYNPEDSSEHHTRRRENLKSHNCRLLSVRAYEKHILDKMKVTPITDYVNNLSLPVAARLDLQAGVPVASNVLSPTGLNFEFRCLRRYAFCQRCLFWLVNISEF